MAMLLVKCHSNRSYRLTIILPCAVPPLVRSEIVSLRLGHPAKWSVRSRISRGSFRFWPRTERPPRDWIPPLLVASLAHNQL